MQYLCLRYNVQLYAVILQIFLDRFLLEDPINSRLGCETFCTTNRIIIGGEGRCVDPLVKDGNIDNYIERENKLKAYAFIMTHPGYPTLFYSDYQNEAFKAQLDKLVSIHNSLAVGDLEVLYTDEDEYIAKRKGTDANPGLIIYITTNTSTKRRTINTGWSSRQLMDYTENSTYYPATAEDGSTQLEAPANGYAIWSVMEE